MSLRWTFVLLAFVAGGVGGAWLKTQPRKANATSSSLAESPAHAKPASSEASQRASHSADPSPSRLTNPNGELPPSVERRILSALTIEGPAQKLDFSHWPLTELRLAADILLRVHRGPLAEGAWTDHYKDLVLAMAKLDTTEALAQARRWPEWEERNELLGDLIEEIGKTDPKKAFSIAMNEKGAGQNLHLLQAAIRSAAEREPNAVGEMSFTSDENWAFFAGAYVAGASRKLSSDQLWSLIQSQPKGLKRQAMEEAFFRQIAGKATVDPSDLQFALAAIEQGRLPAGDWARFTHDPAIFEKLPWLWQLEALGSSIIPFSEMPQFVIAQQLDKASPDTMQPMMIKRLGAFYAADSPGGFREPLMQQIKDPSLRSRVLDAATTALINNKKQTAAIELLNQQTDEALRLRGLMSLGNQWTGNSAEQALAWARQMPPSDERDWALIGIMASSDTEPKNAQSLLPLITSQSARTAAFKTIAVKGLSDPSTAPNTRAWLGNLPLSAEDRADIDAAVTAKIIGNFKPDGQWTGHP